MARRTVIVDDFDGTEGAETLTFAVDGVTYEIDLSAQNMATFRETLGAYIDVARVIAPDPRGGRAAVRSAGTPSRSRKSTGGKTAGKSTGSGSRKKKATAGPGEGRSESARIRSWAAEQGLDVPSRGRVPEQVREAYLAAAG